MNEAAVRTLLAGLLLVQPLISAAQSSCQEVRAGIDVGSGTTKMVVARVDHCAGAVLEVLAPRAGKRLEYAVEYKKNIETAADGRKVFRPQVETQGLEALAALKAAAERHGARAFSAVATSAFRRVTLSYARELTSRIHERLGIPVHVVDQAEEARLGFLASIVKLGVPRTDVLVWDIGGGSMQLSYWDPTKRRVVGYRGEFANNAMQAYVVETLQGHPRGSDLSPNPILSPQQRLADDNPLLVAIRNARAVAASTISREQQERFVKLPVIIGIGGVHYYSNCEVTGQKPGCSVNRVLLRAEILSHGHLTDRQLVEAGRAGSLRYAPKRITAGALTLGFMEALDLERVISMKVDMSDGILVDPAYWR